MWCHDAAGPIRRSDGARIPARLRRDRPDHARLGWQGRELHDDDAGLRLADGVPLARDGLVGIASGAPMTKKIVTAMIKQCVICGEPFRTTVASRIVCSP